MSAAEHAATVREALEAWDHEREENARMTETADAHESLAALVALAERATELERERDHWKQEAEGLASEQRIAEAAVERAERAETALREIGEQQPKTVDWLRANGIVFDGPLGTDPDNWEHVAFSIYNDLCEVDGIARAALGETAHDRS